MTVQPISNTNIMVGYISETGLCRGTSGAGGK